MKSYNFFVKLELNGFYQLPGEAYQTEPLAYSFVYEINDLLFNSTSDLDAD